MFVLPVFIGCDSPDTRLEEKFAEAEQKIALGDVANGIIILEELFRQRPEEQRIARALAFAYAEVGRHVDAGETFSIAAKLAPDDPEHYLFAARSFEEAEQWNRAVSYYQVYIVANFEDFAGWQALGRVEEKRGHYIDAVNAYIRSYNIRPRGEIAIRVAEIFIRLGNLIQARQWYRATLEHDSPASPQALLGLLRICMEEEDWSGAQELVAQLDNRFPGELNRSDIATARDELRNIREAQEELERLARERVVEAERQAERRAREEKEARLAIERAAQAERAAAEEAARRAEAAAREEQARQPSALIEARAFRRDRRWREAIDRYWEAVVDDPENSAIWFELSGVLLESGSYQQAETTAIEALRRAPDREEYHIHYLNTIRRARPLRTYLRELESALERFPRNAEIALALARAYRQGNFSLEHSNHFYRMFLRIARRDDPRRSEAEQALQQRGPT